MKIKERETKGGRGEKRWGTKSFFSNKMLDTGKRGEEREVVLSSHLVR